MKKKASRWNEWKEECRAYGYPHWFCLEQYELYKSGVRDVRICDLLVNFMGKWNINSF